MIALLNFQGRDDGVEVVKETQFLHFCGIRDTKHPNSETFPIRILQLLLLVLTVERKEKRLSELAYVYEDQGL